MDTIAVFRGTSGLNTVADPARIPMTKSGVNDVAEIVNMTVDQYGRPSRRKGFKLLLSGDFHSLFCDRGDCFVAKNIGSDGAIYRVSKTSTDVYALQGIRSGMTMGAKISWLQVGNKTYYANGFERGYIVDGISYAWNVGEYHGIDADKRFSIPENILHLAEHSGCLFASSGNILWWSEPFRYDLFNMTEGFVQFGEAIRMVRPVDGGVYIGTEKNTFFLTGNRPSEFTAHKIAQFGVIEWSDATEYSPQESGLCAVWVSPEGAMLGTPSGQIVNLNKSKVIYPEQVNKGFGCMVGYHFIHGME